MSLYKELLIAIEDRDTSRVRQILALKGYANKQDEDGVTPLMWASVVGEIEILKVLLLYGADIEIRDRDGTTALMCAAYAGHIEIVKELVKNHANINSKQNNGFSAITWANLSCHKEIEDFLIANGADLRTRIGSDENSLFDAINKAIERHDENEVIVTICNKYLNTIKVDISNPINFLKVLYIKLSTIDSTSMEVDRKEYTKFINDFSTLTEAYSMENKEEIITTIKQIKLFLN